MFKQTKLTPNAPIQQIAHAGSMTAATGINQFATVGPSQLWGIDFGGGIYYADAPVVIH